MPVAHWAKPSIDGHSVDRNFSCGMFLYFTAFHNVPIWKV